MCGIVAVVGPSAPLYHHTVKRTESFLRDRGPDSTYLFPLDWASVAFFRLGIYGSHPSVQQDTQAPIVLLNGEIWNVRELASELGLERNSDEYSVLRAAYLRWDAALHEHVDGMYAIVVLDVARQRCVVLRDSIGIKPLFYGRAIGGAHVFSSDVRGVAAIQGRATINAEYVTDLHNVGFASADATLLADVAQVAPGGVVTIEQDGTLRWAQHAAGGDIEADQTSSTSIDQQIDQQIAILSGAVRHCVEHTQTGEVGLLLSGGIDSALLALLLREIGLSDAVQAFTVAGRNDDNVWARRIATEAGIRLIELTPDLAIWSNHLEEPAAALNGYLGLGLYALFQTLKDAAPGTRVVLCGEGADELYGGYSMHHQGREWLMHRVRACTGQHFVPQTRMMGVLRDRLNHGATGLRDMIDLSLRESLNDRHLVPFDLASMASSIEVRVPYLQQSNYHFARSLPLKALGDANKRKLIIQSSLARLGGPLGDAIATRPKRSLPEAMAQYQLREVDLLSHESPDLEPQRVGLTLPTFRCLWLQATLNGVRGVIGDR